MKRLITAGVAMAILSGTSGCSQDATGGDGRKEMEINPFFHESIYLGNLEGFTNLDDSKLIELGYSVCLAEDADEEPNLDMRYEQRIIESAIINFCPEYANRIDW